MINTKWRLGCGLLWIVALLANPLAGQDREKSTDEVVKLFDGSSLDHWRGYAKEQIGEG